MPQYILKVTKDDELQRADNFITQNCSVISSRSFAKKLLDHGHVKANEILIKANHKVLPHEEIIIDIPDDFLTPEYIEPENIPLNIFYEDEQLIIINKPTGLLVHPAQGIYKGTLVNALLHYAVQLSNINSDIRPGIVHRLDQETSGLMVIAKDNITHTKLAKQFQRHIVKKCYVALVEGIVEHDEGVINVPIGRDIHHREKKTVNFSDQSKESWTKYKVLKRKSNVSLVKLFPRTGRTHQLRVHMKYLGHPILGDSKYGRKQSFSRLALHAMSLGFKHPANKEFIEFTTPIPPEFMHKIAK